MDIDSLLNSLKIDQSIRDERVADDPLPLEQAEQHYHDVLDGIAASDLSRNELKERRMLEDLLDGVSASLPMRIVARRIYASVGFKHARKTIEGWSQL